MASRAQLISALRNADAAGDADAARRLAAMIQALPQDAAPVAPMDPGATAPASSKAELYDALRKADAAGDTEAANHFADRIRALPKDGVAPQAGTPIAMPDPMVSQSPVATEQSTTEDQLRADPDWIAASKIIYDMSGGVKRFQPGTLTPEVLSDHDAAEYGLDEIGWFNTNLLQMGNKAHAILGATPEQKKAMLYLMDRSEGLEWSWEGSGRLFRGIATDPSTYLGFGSLGLGTVAAQGGKVMSREGLKLALRAAVNMGARAAVEGAVYGTAANLAHQTVSIQGGGQAGYDGGQALQAAGTGALFGVVIGGTIGTIAHGAANHVANGKIAETEALFGTGSKAEAVAANPTAASPDAPQPSAMAPEPMRAANENAVPVDPSAPRAANENVVAVTPTASPDLAAKLPEGMTPANTNPVAANANTSGLVGPALGVQAHLSAIVDAIQGSPLRQPSGRWTAPRARKRSALRPRVSLR